jgi:hypothetical protein
MSKDIINDGQKGAMIPPKHRDKGKKGNKPAPIPPRPEPPKS